MQILFLNQLPIPHLKVTNRTTQSSCFRVDTHDNGVGAQILRSLGIRKLKLMTNNPVKRIGIKSFGLEIVDQVPIDDSFDFSSQKYPFEEE